MNWMILPLRRYAEFSGRSRRKEYWMFFLLLVIGYIIVGLISAALGFSFRSIALRSAGGAMNMYSGFFSGSGLLFVLFWLATLIPTIAVGVRRLHDRDMSGWWYLLVVLGAIPLVGLLASIAFLVLMVLPGTPGPNRFGSDPKDPLAIDVFA